jgi:DNA-binding PadR family transcriptional regulator
MQYLEDQGLVRADSGTERRVYHLTEAGQTELEAHADDLADFWGRFAGPAEANANSAEIGFLRDALDDLTRTVWRGFPGADSPETIGRIRQAVELCQNAIREIIAEAGQQEF